MSMSRVSRESSSRRLAKRLALTARRGSPTKAASATPGLPGHVAAIATLHSFDVDETPVVTGLAHRPGELVRAHSTVELRSAHIGLEVLVIRAGAQAEQVAIIGILQKPGAARDTALPGARPEVRADGERYVITAEREIVLQCGDSSITLTRAGKVLIKGNYLVSCSTGYNRIKGAAVDIN